MNMKSTVLPTVYCVALLAACATPHTASVKAEKHPNQSEAKRDDQWSVQPLLAKTSNDNPASLYQIGRYYQGQNRFDLALAAYQKALAADAGFVEAINGMGVVYARQGLYLEAVKTFKSAITIAPNAAHIRNNLGYAYYLQGEYANAVDALEQAAQLEPSNQHALNNLGLAYAKIGNQEKSRAVFTRALAATNDVQIDPMDTAQHSAQAVPVATPSAPTQVTEFTQYGGSQHAVDVNEVAANMNVVSKRNTGSSELLALPKDRGLLRPAQQVVMINGNTDQAVGRTVQVAPNVYEWHPVVMPLIASLHPVSAMPLVQGSDGEVQGLTVTSTAKIEVANGNGITGMAGKVGRFLHQSGYQAVRLTNQKPFQVFKTQIQYSHDFRDEAQRLQAMLPISTAALVQRSDLRAGTRVRLLLGQDFSGQAAQLDGRWQALRLAQNDVATH